MYSRSACHNGVWAIMYAWYFQKDSLPPVSALNTIDFGSANVPLNDSNFTNNLNKAWFR
ncbi:hypothetical protein G3352_13330 [Paenibacillus sp. ALJ109b]|nr:hypothetical protein [Paenibacillus sp. ALJ109b]